MHAFIRARLDDVDAAHRQVESMLHATSVEQRSWRPEPDAWSILQVLAHLNATADAYHPRAQRLIDRLRARDETRSDGYRPSLLGRLTVYLLGTSSTIKLKAFGPFTPKTYAGDEIDERCIEHYRTQQLQLRILLEQADGLSLNRLSMAEPVSPLLRLSLGEAFEALTAHQKRHLAQIERIRHHPRFPLS
ncbi:MAG: DinB family protein [Acidobacteriota bacterium]